MLFRSRVKVIIYIIPLIKKHDGELLLVIPLTDNHVVIAPSKIIVV